MASLEQEIAGLKAEVVTLTAAIRELIGGGTSLQTSGAANAAGEEKTTETKSRRGRGAKEDKAAEDKADAKEETQQQTETKGRRGRGAANKENAEAETKGRRSRKKENPVNDTPEQAEMRANLTEDLRVLADHDQAIDDVTEALQRVGSTNIKDIPSDLLEDFDADIGEIFTKYGL